MTVVNNPLFPDHDCTTTPPATALLGRHVCATGLDFPTSCTAAFTPAFRNSVYVAECGPFSVQDLLEKTLEGVPAAAHHNTGHKR